MTGGLGASLNTKLGVEGLDGYRRDMKSAGQEVGVFAKNTNNSLRMAETAHARFQKSYIQSMRSIGQSTKSVGRTMTRDFTVPVTAAFGYSVKAAADLDLSLHKINSLTGLTGTAARKSFGSFKVEVRQLSDELGIAQKTLSEGLYQAISSGIPKQNSMEFMRVAAKGAVAGITDVETSVDALSTVVNSFKDQNLKAKDAMDIMFQTVNAGKIEFPELAQYIGQTTAFADAAHVSFSDLGAAIATMTIKGVKGRIAVTDIKAALVSVMNPTDDMKHAYKKLGVDGWDQLLKRSGSMQAAFGKIRDASGGSNDKLIKMLGTMEAAQTVLQLTGTNAKDASTSLDQMRHSSGATAKAFNEIDKSDSRKFERMKVEVQNAAISIGSDLMPNVLKLAHGVKSAADSFSHLSHGTQTAIEVGAGLLAVTGPMLSMLGNAAIGASVLAKAYQRVAGTAAEATVAENAQAAAAMRSGMASATAAAEMRAAGGIGSSNIFPTAAPMKIGGGANLAGSAGAAEMGAAELGVVGGSSAMTGAMTGATAGTEALGVAAAATAAETVGMGAALSAAAIPLAVVAGAALVGYGAYKLLHRGTKDVAESTKEAHVSMAQLKATAPMLAKALHDDKAAAHDAAKEQKDLAAATDAANRAASRHPTRPGHRTPKPVVDARNGRNQAEIDAATASANAIIKHDQALKALGITAHNVGDALDQLHQHQQNISSIKTGAGMTNVHALLASIKGTDKELNGLRKDRQDLVRDFNRKVKDGSVNPQQAKEFRQQLRYINRDIRDFKNQKIRLQTNLKEEQGKVRVLRSEIMRMAGMELKAPGVARGILKGMTDAQRKAQFGTKNINSILKAIGSGKGSPKMEQGVQKMVQQIIKAAQKGKTNTDTIFATYGQGIGPAKTVVDAFVASLETMPTKKTVTIEVHGHGAKVKGQPVVTTYAFAKGGSVAGAIRGAGTKASDSIPAVLSNGEFVIDADGSNILDAMRYYGVKGFKRGGPADLDGNGKVSASERRDYNFQKGDTAWGKLQDTWREKESAALLKLTRAQGTAKNPKDDIAAYNSLVSIYGKEASKFQKFLSHHPGKLSASTKASVYDAIRSAIESQRQMQKERDSFKKTGSVDGTGDTTGDLEAQLAQSQERLERMTANYNLSQAQYGVLNGSGDLGYGGGSNAVGSAGGAMSAQPQTVNNIYSLSGYDPAIQRALANSSNGGNSSGANADKLYSGRIRTGA